MNTPNRREVTHRATAAGLAALMTWSLLGIINLLAVEPTPGSLLARQQVPVQVAMTPVSAEPRS
jgi:hypothetical protein